jgi:Holliday junction resolvase
MPNEKERVVNPILKWLRKNGAFAEKTHGSEYTRIGMPDIIACCDGRYVAIEAKYPGGKVTDAQARCIAEIRNARGLGIFADDLEFVKQVLWSRLQWPS